MTDDVTAERDVPKFSYLDHLECGRCGARHDADVVQSTCACGAPLLARYDLVGVGTACSPTVIGARPLDLWRYHELLPVRSAEAIVGFGEGVTPLMDLPRMGAAAGIGRLQMKDEGVLPTGTFKARGAAVGVSRAHELGIDRVAMPTNGNAGAAWAAYAARAGMTSLIVMPVDAPLVTRAECAVAGSDVYLVDGLIGDAGAIVGRVIAASDHRYMDASTLKEPYRLEGKKTMGLELFEQLGWTVPDVVLYPTGGGVGLVGIHKALQECRALGWLGERMPRLVAVQAEGCAPIVRAWERRAASSEEWEDARSVAFGIVVPNALGDFLVLRALYETEGCAVAVSDGEILAAQKRLGNLEGAFVCPEGAACFAAAARLRSTGWLGGADHVVIFNTGAGITCPQTVEVDVPTLAKRDGLVPRPE